ncbi:MAG TPA: MBL fold metallo-hydrolase [Bryobacteraceae bacterium]|nr:MBL fold metallo-hydrolase [Bryobacteraceae bacterium]
MCSNKGPDEVSRRSFLKSGGTGIAASPLLSGDLPEQPTRFQPNSRPEKLSDNLFLLEDTCNVYLIRKDDHALLIDFGSGKILDFLPELGISKVDFILHTHHHRDQAQGDHLAVAQRIPIAVPEHEREFFESAENFWRNRRIYELYEVRNDFFSLTQNIPVAVQLHDYSTFHWGDTSLFVQPTPGHTLGSITLVCQVDGRKVAFSGDLMHSPGKVKTLYDLQYYYQEHEGVDFSIYSLTELGKLKPDLLCPSHGRPVPEPIPGMEQLIQKLRDWHHYWYAHPPTSDYEPYAVSPHLVANTDTTSSFYAIISNSGKALFVDYGSASWVFFQVFTRYVGTRNHMRFVEHSIEKIRARHGMKAIDVAIPSHVHDDHLNGFPHLARRYGTKIWCYENMVHVLENPRGLNIGCVFGEPLKIERSFRDKETFKWEEFEFTVVHSPGHTNYQMAMFATIDGARVAFTGDAFFNDPDHPNSLRHNLIYRNEVKSGDHLKSIRNILEFEPNIIAPGHGRPFLINREAALGFEQRAKKQDEFFRDLIADPDPNMGIDPSWIKIYPYQLSIPPGGTAKVRVKVRNYRPRRAQIDGMFVLPGGWRATPERVSIAVNANSDASAEAVISVPANYSNPHSRIAIALDVMADNKYLGQIAEAVVDLPVRES